MADEIPNSRPGEPIALGERADEHAVRAASGIPLQRGPAADLMVGLVQGNDGIWRCFEYRLEHVCMQKPTRRIVRVAQPNDADRRITDRLEERLARNVPVLVQGQFYDPPADSFAHHPEHREARVRDDRCAFGTQVDAGHEKQGLVRAACHDDLIGGHPEPHCQGRPERLVRRMRIFVGRQPGRIEDGPLPRDGRPPGRVRIETHDFRLGDAGRCRDIAGHRLPLVGTQTRDVFARPGWHMFSLRPPSGRSGCETPRRA